MKLPNLENVFYEVEDFATLSADKMNAEALRR